MVENKGALMSIRFLHIFAKFFELKKQLDDCGQKDVDFFNLFDEFEEKLINNMKLICFKVFLKDG